MSWFSRLFHRRRKKPVSHSTNTGSNNSNSEQNYNNHWNKDINFRAALALVFAFEGGYSNDRYDSGGKTKYGIIESEAREWGYHGNMRDLTRDFASKIYYLKYWKSQNLDKIAEVSPKIATEVFEMGVNMGSSRGNKALQRALNLMNRRGKLYPDMTVDGKIGSKTVSALKRLPENDYPIVVKLINAIQGEWYMKFAENRESQEVFIRGWFKRVQFED